MRNFLPERHKERIVFLLFILQAVVVYKLIQAYVHTDRIFSIPLIDNNIPVISPFVVPYFLLFPVIAMPFLLTLRDRKTFLKVSYAFLFAATLCNVIYVLFQTTILRPEIISSNIFDQILLFIYSIDEPLNLFPSGHVTYSVLATLCLLKINRKMAYYTIPVTVLIILSTLFIKQHHFPDVVAGLIVAYVSYHLFFKRFSALK